MSSFNDKSAKRFCGEDREVNEMNDNLEKLKSLRSKVNLEIEEERLDFLRQLYDLTNDWKGQLPNLRDIFSKEEIDSLLIESVTLRDGEDNTIKRPFINFVIRSGYKDKPDLDKDGKPLLRCTTAMHHVARSSEFWFVHDLLQIYDVDANYTYEDGLTHLHVASLGVCHAAVQKFLELGQDPNGIWQETGETPLHLALENNAHVVVKSLLKGGADPNLINKQGSNCLHVICERANDDYDAMLLFKYCHDERKTLQVDVGDNEGNAPLHLALGKSWRMSVEMLLRMGANPNLANERGWTPLHIICAGKWAEEFDYDDSINGEDDLYDYEDCDLMVSFFKILDETNQLVHIDAQDQGGRTPLHLALWSKSRKITKLLLKLGANPNLANEDGLTPVHIVCQRNYYSSLHLVQLFFEIDRRANQLIQIDAPDKKGRTPLQIAVANCVLPTVDILLEHGADLSAFVFPTTSHFVETWKPLMDKMSIYPKLQLASGLMVIVERLEKKGYELKPSDVRTIMTVLDECGCLKKSADLHRGGAASISRNGRKKCR